MSLYVLQLKNYHVDTRERNTKMGKENGWSLEFYSHFYSEEHRGIGLFLIYCMKIKWTIFTKPYI